MTHIFKPGDKAYWLRHSRWIYLIRNRNFPESGYSLEDQETHTYFTLEGKLAECNTPELLPLNPYNISDPNNPPEFRSDWPFMLNGRKVKIGDELIINSKKLKVYHLLLDSENKPTASMENAVDVYYYLTHPFFRFPDELLPEKKTTYLWALPMYEAGLKELLSIRFERMTKEEAGKHWMAEMVPGSEEEE